MLFRVQLFFSSWQFSYLVILVPEKAQSGSYQNKKLPTLNGFSRVSCTCLLSSGLSFKVSGILSLNKSLENNVRTR